MADSFSALLRFRLQQTGANENTWGTLLNSAAIQLIEDSIAGAAIITVAGSDVTLTTANGANDQSRRAILRLGGAPGAPRNIIIPTLSKMYVVENDTGSIMTIKSSVPSSLNVAVQNGVTTIVMCNADGDVTEISPQSAANAANASALGGIPAANYARLDNRQTFSKAQMSVPVAMAMGAAVVPEFDKGNIFTGTLTGNTTFDVPSSLDAEDAQTFEMVIRQTAAGGPYTATFNAFYDFLGQTPSMPTSLNSILYVTGVVIPALGKAICVSQSQSASTVSDVVLSVNENNVDMFRRLGSPAGIVNVSITVAAGVVISSDSPAEPALDFSGGFASGSTISLINLGFIIGKGGRGSDGAWVQDDGDADCAFGVGAGEDGGNAIRAPGAGITFNITNAAGRIWGGGGGGGAGGLSANDQGIAVSGGGGGGAGRGQGGMGGRGKRRGNVTAVSATNGGNGRLALDGSAAGGPAGSTSTGGNGFAGAPGDGGDYGAGGNAGTANTTGTSMQLAPAAGGVAGKAIDLTGASPTFVNGSGSPNVKGAVS